MSRLTASDLATALHKQVHLFGNYSCISTKKKKKKKEHESAQSQHPLRHTCAPHNNPESYQRPHTFNGMSSSE